MSSVSRMSRKTSRNISISVCVGAALMWLLLGFVPQREGIELRRRINPTTATLRQDDVPAPIIAAIGSPWSIRATIQPNMPKNAISALETGNTQEQARWILFDKNGVRLRTFEGRQSLTATAADEIFTPLLPLDGSPEPVILYGILPLGYGEGMGTDGLPLRWHNSRHGDYTGGPLAECDARRPAPAITSERILTALSTQSTQSGLSGQSYSSNTFDRARRYQALVESFARRFGLHPALVYAIIHAESNFTPLLVSSRSAMGLMQLLPSTAGGEVHTFLHGRPASVSLNELSNPETNIRYGTAYLHLLLNRHLGEINDPLSREYCAVAAYNMGPNRFVKLYPPETINAMTPAQVLEHLTTSLPFSETRAFVAKVTRTREEFATSFGDASDAMP